MAKIEVLETIPDSYKRSFINSGANGRCYKTEYGDVYKEFSSRFIYEEEIKTIGNIDSNYFAFPNIIVYLRKKLKGYRMDFVEGEFFKKLDRKTKIKVLINAAINMEKEIINLSKEYGIGLYDLNDGNVIFQSTNEFKVMDTDLYEIASSYELYDLLKRNIKEWNEFLLYNMACKSNIFKSDKLNNRFELALHNGKVRASDLIMEIVSEIRKEIKKDIITLDDYYNGIKIIKRKVL